MFGFKKNKVAKKSVVHATDVAYKEVSTQPSAPPSTDTPNQSDASQTIQLLMNFAMGHLASGKTGDEVTLLIKNQGANADVASLIINRANDALAQKLSQGI